MKNQIQKLKDKRRTRFILLMKTISKMGHIEIVDAANHRFKDGKKLYGKEKI